MSKRVTERTAHGAAWVAILAGLSAAPAALAKPGGGKCAATITGKFADSCRDFAAHSSKDISYVEIHYVDGSVVKDESIHSHDHAVDGGAGDEIAFAIVKSGTTKVAFDCVQDSAEPAALLEIETPPYDQTLEHCYDFFAGGLDCEQSSPRTAWTSTDEIPDTGGSESGLFHWGCGAFGDPSQCSLVMRFRGIGSSDPDGDIESWSIDFGDGASLSGSWVGAPPDVLEHEYSLDASGNIACAPVDGFAGGVCQVTLTVIDSAGQSAGDTLLMAFVDQTPD